MPMLVDWLIDDDMMMMIMLIDNYTQNDEVVTVTRTQVCWWQRGRLRTKASSVFAVLQGARPRKCSLANCAEKCCVLKRRWSGTSLTSTPNDKRSIAVWSANVCTAHETRSWPTSTPTTSRGLVTTILNSFRICLLYVPRPQVLSLLSLSIYLSSAALLSAP